MRILLINQAFVSPDEPGHTRHFEMAKFLQARGHELVIVASDLNYQTGQRTVARKGVFAEQNFDGVRVLRSYIYPALHRSYVWRIVSFFSFMFSSVWTALHARDVDLVMGTTPPIFQAVSAWFVALVRRKPFLLEVRDLWPEFGVSMGVLTNPVLIALGRWLALTSCLGWSSSTASRRRSWARSEKSRPVSVKIRSKSCTSRPSGWARC